MSNPNDEIGAVARELAAFGSVQVIPRATGPGVPMPQKLIDAIFDVDRGDISSRISTDNGYNWQATRLAADGWFYQDGFSKPTHAARWAFPVTVEAFVGCADCISTKFYIETRDKSLFWRCESCGLEGEQPRSGPIQLAGGTK